MTRSNKQPPELHWHMSNIKSALANHKVSYSQFAQFMKSDEYPFKGQAGTRKQRIQATSAIVTQHPDVFDQLVRDAGLSRAEDGE